jgi:hypothetical protein
MCNLETLLNERLTEISEHAFAQHVQKLAEDIRVMRAALAARAWHHRHGPSWAQELPLCPCEHERLLCSGYLHMHLVSHYAESVRGWSFDIQTHPPFVTYVRGALAAGIGEIGLLDDEPWLLEDFPPKRLPGLDAQGQWRPLPGSQAKVLLELQRAG